MPGLLAVMIALSSHGVLTAVTDAQPRNPAAPLDVEDLACSFCHVCQSPTSKYLCLQPCPRTSTAVMSREMSKKRGPNIVLLKELEDLYLPVPFDHRGHAEMTKMTNGCAVCHHFTPEGVAHPACKNCHEISPKREDMKKPSLKGAYHRQCMGCHREWSHKTACGICHPPKAGVEGEGAAVGTPTVGDIVGRMHPPIPEPHTEIYEPSSKPLPGERIVFRHKEHIDRFGLLCVDCHREDSCLRCHEEGASHSQQQRTLEQHHKPCSSCHDVENKDACDHCHWKEGEAKPKPFDHTDTGWVLNDHHAQLGCRTCHKEVPFRKLDRECDACHSDWQPDSFDHAVTGQMLSEEHEDVTCEDCHTDRKFDKPPVCNECHEEDEGISYPAQRPGVYVIPSQRGSRATPEE